MPLPEILNFGFKINESKLWDLDIPVEKMKIADLNHNLDIPYLEQEGTNDWNLTPRMLINNFEKESTHAKKVDKANLKYPIEIYKHKDKWIILDGVHRFTKAVQSGKETIKVRKITDEIIAKVKMPDKEYKKWKEKI